MKATSFLKINFVFFLSFYIFFSAFSQQKRLEFNLGFAPPLDAFHAGFNFHASRTLDLGFSFGIVPLKFDFNNYSNVGFESKYKFGESRYLKERVELDGRLRNVWMKTWYAGFRGNFIKNLLSEDEEKRYVYITPSIGRHCNINQIFGFNIDFGLSFTASQKIKYLGNDICRSCFIEQHPKYPLLPTLRIQFFAKI